MAAQLVNHERTFGGADWMWIRNDVGGLREFVHVDGQAGSMAGLFTAFYFHFFFGLEVFIASPEGTAIELQNVYHA